MALIADNRAALRLTVLTNSASYYFMNENTHTIRLWNFLIGRDVWGRDAGAAVQQKLANRIDSQPGVGVLRLSMDGVKRLDVTFASEAIVGLIRRYLGSMPICLVNLADQDIVENIAAAAERMKVPVTIWNGQNAQVIGPAPSRGIREALTYALARPEVRAAEFARVAGLSSANASTTFKHLWEQGFLMRFEGSAPSGGAEFVYRRIG